MLSIIEEKITNWINNIENYNESNIFEETPPTLDEFLFSKEWLGMEKLSPKQYEFIEYGTQIYYNKEYERLGWNKVRNVGELVAMWGKGSGKDMCSQIIMARIANLLICLKNPQKYYNQMEYSSIDMLNMAYNSNQAESVFFKTFSEIVDNVKWFKDKSKVNKNSIEFSKRIYAYSGNSYEESFEGKNLIIAVLDEISAFKTRIELEQLQVRRLRAPRYSAESVYDMAKSSVESRFGGGIGKVISISFPRFKDDFIEQLYKKGINEHTCYASFGATWDVHPHKKREDFADEYRKNPERAEAKYACNVQGVEGGYFKNKAMVRIALPEIDKDKVPTTDNRFPKIKDWVRCNHSSICSIHIDLGLKKDKAGICISHIAGIVEDVRKNDLGEKEIVELPIVELDLHTAFIAPLNGEINFSLVRELITDLSGRGYNIGLISLDGYQSVDFIQIMKKRGYEVVLRSMDRDTSAYDTLKELIYDSRLKGYSYVREIETAKGITRTNELVEEMENLIFNGRKIDHTAYSSKDITDAVAGSIQGAIEIGYSACSKDDIIEGQDREVADNQIVYDREFLSGIDTDSFEI